MAVPRYRGGTVAVRGLPTSPLQRPGPTQESFGVEFANQVQRQAFGWSRLIQQEQQVARERADRTAVLKADNDLTEWEGLALYGPDGALQKKGEDAFGLPEKVSAAYTKKASEVAAKLTTDEQRQAFERVRVQRQSAIMRAVYQHVGGEIESYHKEQSARGIDLATQHAIANASDLVTVGEDLGKVDTLVHDAMKGSSPEAVQAALLQARTNIHLGVIDRFVANDQEMAAKTYYEGVRDQIDGRKYSQVEKLLEEGGLRAKSQRVSDQILEQATSEKQALEMVRELTGDDAKLRDEVEQRVLHGFAVKKAATSEQHENDMKEAAQILDAGRGYSAIPARIRSSLSVGEMSQLRSYAKSLIDKEENDDTPAKRLRYYQLMEEAADHPEVFTTRNLGAELGKVRKSDWTNLVELKERLKKGEKPKAIDDYMTKSQILKEMLPKGIKEDSDEAKKIHRAFDLEANAWQRANKKEIDNETARDIADKLVQRVVLAPGWFGTTIGEDTKRAVDITYNDIPVRTRTEIERRLKSAGLPANPENVRDEFIRLSRQQGQVR